MIKTHVLEGLEGVVITKRDQLTPTYEVDARALYKACPHKPRSYLKWLREGMTAYEKDLVNASKKALKEVDVRGASLEDPFDNGYRRTHRISPELALELLRFAPCNFGNYPLAQTVAQQFGLEPLKPSGWSCSGQVKLATVL